VDNVWLMSGVRFDHSHTTLFWFTSNARRNPSLLGPAEVLAVTPVKSWPRLYVRSAT